VAGAPPIKSLNRTVSLEEFLCRDSKQFLAASFTKTQEYRAHNSPPFLTFGSLHCRKRKEEVKSCRKFKGTIDVLGPEHLTVTRPTLRSRNYMRPLLQFVDVWRKAVGRLTFESFVSAPEKSAAGLWHAS
jgi:hypothetical protein